jgi:hypothetical protein
MFSYFGLQSPQPSRICLRREKVCQGSQECWQMRSQTYIINDTPNFSKTTCTLPRLPWIHICLSAESQQFLTKESGYPHEDYLKASLTILIPSHSHNMCGPATRPSPMPYPRAYEKTKDYLKNMLKQMLVHIEKFPGTGPELLRTLGPVDAAHELKNQLKAFWRGEYPFIVSEEAKGKNPLEWWQNLEHHIHARILASLAIWIFSILVNSMPDEHTNSTITWFNSAI